MGIKDVLPDRELYFDEFQDLQSSDAFDRVMTGDTPGIGTDVLILTKGENEYVLHYTDEQGWHHCGEVQE